MGGYQSRLHYFHVVVCDWPTTIVVFRILRAPPSPPPPSSPLSQSLVSLCRCFGQCITHFYFASLVRTLGGSPAQFHTQSDAHIHIHIHSHSQLITKKKSINCYQFPCFNLPSLEPLFFLL